MKDSIEIKDNKIIAKLSITVKQKDNSYIGYIPSFDIPFTSPSEEKAGEIAGGLINALFQMWLKKGKIKLVKEKLEKYKFSQNSRLREYRFEHSAPSKSMRIEEELYVA